jgi:hypothetical protein
VEALHLQRDLGRGILQVVRWENRQVAHQEMVEVVRLQQEFELVGVVTFEKTNKLIGRERCTFTMYTFFFVF